jgi:hypothetical protein
MKWTYLCTIEDRERKDQAFNLDVQELSKGKA